MSSDGPRATQVMQHADLLLCVVGVVVLAVSLVSQRETAVTVLLILVATALLLTGALLPRLSGKIKVSPTGIEVEVLQRIEWTRSEALRRAPDQVPQALHQAYLELLPVLADLRGPSSGPIRAHPDPVDAASEPPPPAAPAPRPADEDAAAAEATRPTADAPRRPTTPDPTRSRRRIVLPVMGAVLAATWLVMGVVIVLLSSPTGLAPPEPAEPAEPTGPVGVGIVLIVVALLALVWAIIVAWRKTRPSASLARRRAAQTPRSAPPVMEPPEAFARRIVDHVVTTPDTDHPATDRAPDPPE